MDIVTWCLSQNAKKNVFIFFKILECIKKHFVENNKMSQQIGTFHFKNAGTVVRNDTSICIFPHVLNVFEKKLVFYNKK